MAAPIVLINPPVKRVIEEYDTPPYGHIGLAYLAAALRKAGLDCIVLDAKLARLSYEQVLASVLEINPRIVGITSFTHEISITVQLANQIKQRLAHTTIVIGGVHASSLPADTLKNFDCFDFLIQGEGERSFIKLSKAIIDDKKDLIPAIAGLGYRDKNKIIVVPQDDWINDLSCLPFPAWDLYPPMRIFFALSSRGCPYKCIFCARMLGNKARLRPPENVVAELKMLNEKFGAKKVYFCDETFGLHREWLMKFLTLIVQSGLPSKLKWTITTRAHLINPELLQKFKKAGCEKIDFGVESGDKDILKIIKKGEAKEDFLKAAKLLKKAGIKSHSYFILGHPHETKKTALNTINFAAQLNTDYISIGIMVPYPGTEVAELAIRGEGGYKKISPDWSAYNKQLADALELESLSRIDLTKLQLLGYLGFYIRNLKIIPFFSALWKYKRLILAILFKYLNAYRK